jgi:hypothetical protein
VNVEVIVTSGRLLRSGLFLRGFFLRRFRRFALSFQRRIELAIGALSASSFVKSFFLELDEISIRETERYRVLAVFNSDMVVNNLLSASSAVTPHPSSLFHLFHED